MAKVICYLLFLFLVCCKEGKRKVQVTFNGYRISGQVSLNRMRSDTVVFIDSVSFEEVYRINRYASKVGAWEYHDSSRRLCAKEFYAQDGELQTREVFYAVDKRIWNWKHKDSTYVVVPY